MLSPGEKPSKVLVTGSRGFIGRHLCRRLEHVGLDVQTMSSELSNGCTKEDPNAVMDIMCLDNIDSLQEDTDVIIHLAAKTSVPYSFVKPYETYYTNILGTLNLLELARQRNVHKFVFTSTYVYGQPKYLPVDEKHDISPHSPYQRSKLVAERLCEIYSNDFGINVVTLRPFYVYGPNSRSSSFIFSAIRQIKGSGTVILSGKQTARDFLYVSDFVKLIEMIVKKFPQGHNVYNVGYGKSYTLKQVSELLGNILHKKVVIKYNEQMRRGDITSMVADTSKVSKAFNWKPLVDLEKGLNLTVTSQDEDKPKDI